MIEPEPDLRTRWHQLLPLLAGLVVLLALTPFLPEIDLDSVPADVMVRITDTGAWPQLTLLVLALTIVLITRPGTDAKRRAVEGTLIMSVMLVGLAGNGLLNEHVVKPAFGVPRPNIVDLAEDGLLGDEIPDAASFYSVGGKGARREVLEDRFALLPDLGLSRLVEAHWIHETGFSFPSGHSTAAVTLATFFAALGVWWLSGRRRRWIIMVVPLWAAFVVYSRPLLEVHTTFDVLAGALAGIAWGVAAAWVVDRGVNRAGLHFAAQRG
jgi:phosphatidylglycerophosphatase B